MLLALTFLVPAVPALVDPGPLTCSTPVVDVESVFEQRDAPPGGAFWLRQADDASRFAGQLTLVDANNNELVASDVRRTLETVSFAVPGGAAVGDTYLLREDGVDVGVTLNVVEPIAGAAASLVDVTVGPTVADPCPEAFCSATGESPRAQTVDVTYQGGPVLIDVAATQPEEVFTDLTLRAVDSQLLEQVDAPTTINFVAGPARSTSTPIDVVVRLRSIDDRSVVDERALFLGETAEPADGVAPPLCNDGQQFPTGGCEPAAFGCGVNCPPSAALLLAPLWLRRRLRRKGFDQSPV